MDSPDGFQHNVATYSGPPDFASQGSCDAESEQYLDSTIFPPSSSAPTLTTPSMQGSPAAEARKAIKKRIRKKQPKLEYCTTEQITRRREQNRRSQRAYRERRETHLQTLQDRIDVVELENERLQVALESLRGEVAALRSGMTRGNASGSFGMGSGHSTCVDYSSYPLMYPKGGTQPYAWGMGF